MMPDVLEQLQLQYLVFAIAGAVFFAWRKPPHYSILLAACFLVSILPAWAIIQALYVHPPAGPRPVQSEPVAIVTANLWEGNPWPDRVIEQLSSVSADILVLEELDGRMTRRLAKGGALKRYPYSAFLPRHHMAIFSRYPLRRVNLELSAGKISQEDIRLLGVRVQAKHTAFTLVAAHMPSPILPGWAHQYAPNMDALESVILDLPQPLVVAGDLNTAPWSSRYQRLLAVTAMRDTLWGQGLQLTWPTYFPPAWMPIDHVWVSREIQVLDRSLLPFNGSDHFPVRVKVAIPNHLIGFHDHLEGQKSITR